MKLTINALDPASIDAAIKALKDYKKGLEDKAKLLAERIAEMGREKAQYRFDNAMYDGDLNVNVSTVKTENGWIVSADGQAVCFIEFGTGVYFNSTNANYPGNRPAGLVDIGQYGYGYGKGDYWTYKDVNGTSSLRSIGYRRRLRDGREVVVSYGNPANLALYYTSQEMRQKITSMAKEVFADA